MKSLSSFPLYNVTQFAGKVENIGVGKILIEALNIKLKLSCLIKKLKRLILKVPITVIMPLCKDLAHPLPAEERRRHKLKRLVQHPNSYFMDVKCPGCYKICTIFSNSSTEVLCSGCLITLSRPTGGRARLAEGCSFRKKKY